MAGVGYEGALGTAGLYDTLRQQVMDRLWTQNMKHQQDVEDAKLQIERDRYAQEAADHASLRDIQRNSALEGSAKALAGNMTPGQLISPELAQRFKNTTLAPLIQSGQPTAIPSAFGQNATDTTGESVFAGTPAQREQQQYEQQVQSVLNDPNAPKGLRIWGMLRPPGDKSNPPKELLAPDGAGTEPVVRTNAATGKVERLVNGAWQPVTGDVPKGSHFMPEPQPREANPQPQIFTGADGKQHAIQFVGGAAREIPLPDGMSKLNAVTENRVASARAVNDTGNDIVAQLSDPTLANQLGPVMGKFNTVRDFIGNPPPQFSKLAGEIESFSLANMGVHGMRSSQGADKIKKLLDAHHTPESLIGAIQGLQSFSNHFVQNETGMAPASHDIVGPPAPANSGWTIQR